MAKTLSAAYEQELKIKGLLLTGTNYLENEVNRARLLALFDDAIAFTTSGADSGLLSGNDKRADKRVREAVVSFGLKGEDLDRNVVVSMRNDEDDEVWYTVILHRRSADIPAYYKNKEIPQDKCKTALDFFKLAYARFSKSTENRLGEYKIYTDGSKVVGNKPAAYPYLKSRNSKSPSGSLKSWDIKLDGGYMHKLNPSMFLLLCFNDVSPKVYEALKEAGYCIEHIHRSEPGYEVQEGVFDLSNLQLAPSGSFNSRLRSLRPWDRR